MGVRVHTRIVLTILFTIQYNVIAAALLLLLTNYEQTLK